MIELTIIIVCLILSAVFSASETAFSSANRIRLQAMSNKKKKGAALALKMLEDDDALLSTILIGNNIVNIAMATVSTVLFVKWFNGCGPTLSTIIVTVVVLLFGEIAPKSIAKDFPETFACFIAPFLRILKIILWPINFVFSAIKKLVSKIFVPKDDSLFTTEELLLMFEEGEKEGTLDPDESELLSNTVEFFDCIVADVMTPINQVEAINAKSSKSEIAKRFETTEYSRIPIYKENLNNIIGILHQKDFFTKDGITNKPVSSLITKPLFVRETAEASEALKAMQEKNTHMCIVMNKKHKVLGVVTMEDLLEELVGEIEDEHD